MDSYKSLSLFFLLLGHALSATDSGQQFTIIITINLLTLLTSSEQPMELVCACSSSTPSCQQWPPHHLLAIFNFATLINARL